jgi:hypothetical protein
MLIKNGTMKKNILVILCISFLLIGLFSSAQNKQEREHRIKKSQFPIEALQIVAENNQEFKRLKFYKEVDSTSKKYTAKFKKAELFYEMAFNENGQLNALGFAIKPLDMPEESFRNITEYLSQEFEKSKVRKMFQTYPIQANKNMDKTIINAFQNLMLSDIIYELFVKGKKDGIRYDIEISFDFEGNFVSSRKALPPNYDRVLY